MYTLQLQHPAVTLQASCLHGLVTKPSSPSLRLVPPPTRLENIIAKSELSETVSFVNKILHYLLIYLQI
jgi:hypothetical protein